MAQNTTSSRFTAYIKSISLKKRLTLGALLVVLLILTFCSLGTLIIIKRQTEQVKTTAVIYRLYYQAENFINLEALSLHEYLFQPRPHERARFTAKFQQAQKILKEIERQEKGGKESGVTPASVIIAEQNRLFPLVQRFFALIDAQATTQLVALHDTTIEPLVRKIDTQIGRNAVHHFNLTMQKITEMEIVLLFVSVGVTLAFVFGLSMIFFLLWLFNHYQKQQFTMELNDQELQYMAHVQLQLLSQKLPDMAGLEMYARCRPARHVGGDFYTFNKHSSGQCVLTIGDVSGKGLRAALLMGMVRTIVQVVVHALLQLEPEAIANKINEDLYDDFTEIGMFATVFVGCYDQTEQWFRYTNMGQSPVIYYHIGSHPRLLDANGPPIGVLSTLHFESTVLPFTSGDILVLATDGLSEAQSTKGEFFGYERLLALVESLKEYPARDIAEALFDTVSRFAAGCDQFDDQTIVVVKNIGTQTALAPCSKHDQEITPPSTHL